MTTTLQYRFAEPADIPALASLAAHSFPGAHRTREWWTGQLLSPVYGGGPAITYLAEHDGWPVAMLQAHPLRQWVAGRLLDVTGIGTVAISPTHRRHGIAASLMGGALRAGRDRGDVASALYPFRASFYRRLGYGEAGQVLQYRVPPATLPDTAERVRVELIEDPAGRAVVLTMYNEWAATQTGQLERGPTVWRHMCETPGRVLVACRSEDVRADTVDGYALVTYRNDLPVEDRYLEVDELVWTKPSARRALYGWLASLGDQWQQLLLRALPSQRLGDWLSEPRLPAGSAPGWSLWAPAATLLNGPMFRLLDVGAAFAGRAVAPSEPAVLRVELEDTQIEENAGGWTLALESDALLVERTNPRARGSVPILRTDVSTLSRIYVGAITSTAAVDAGLAECDRPELLAPFDTALALPEPWTFDRF